MKVKDLIKVLQKQNPNAKIQLMHNYDTSVTLQVSDRKDVIDIVEFNQVYFSDCELYASAREL